jgi:hypothetical protein
VKLVKIKEEKMNLASQNHLNRKLIKIQTVLRKEMTEGGSGKEMKTPEKPVSVMGPGGGGTKGAKTAFAAMTVTTSAVMTVTATAAMIVTASAAMTATASAAMTATASAETTVQNVVASTIVLVHLVSAAVMGSATTTTTTAVPSTAGARALTPPLPSRR